jgi:hypothetical protein
VRWEAEIGGSRIQSQSGLYSETLTQKEERIKKEKEKKKEEEMRTSGRFVGHW